jgi:hypothetical protein
MKEKGQAGGFVCGSPLSLAPTNEVASLIVVLPDGDAEVVYACPYEWETQSVE